MVKRKAGYPTTCRCLAKMPRNTEVTFWCVRACTKTATGAPITAKYCSSVEEVSIGAFLRMAKTCSSALHAALRADSLRKMHRMSN